MRRVERLKSRKNGATHLHHVTMETAAIEQSITWGSAPPQQTPRDEGFVTAESDRHLRCRRFFRCCKIRNSCIWCGLKFHSRSMVDHLTVNQSVVGSSPACGANFQKRTRLWRMRKGLYGRPSGVTPHGADRWRFESVSGRRYHTTFPTGRWDASGFWIPVAGWRSSSVPGSYPGGRWCKSTPRNQFFSCCIFCQSGCILKA